MFNSFVFVGDDVFVVDTLEEIEIAQQAMREIGEERTEVWVGEPEDPESYKNGQILFCE